LALHFQGSVFFNLNQLISYRKAFDKTTQIEMADLLLK